MKNTIFFILAVFLLSATLHAQSTADSIAAKYKLLPMPQALTLEKTFPVLGTYQLSSDATDAQAATVTVTLDPTNKGIIWIEGLTEGKFRAFLKKTPSVYRVIAQKSESGKSIPEGTLVYDAGSGQLQLALGKAFNDEDPTAVFLAANTESTAVKGKAKTKIKYYTAIKSQPDASVATETGTSSLQ